MLNINSKSQYAKKAKNKWDCDKQLTINNFYKIDSNFEYALKSVYLTKQNAETLIS